MSQLKSTGIVRKVDELGRIVLPIELRRTLDIGEKDALEIIEDSIHIAATHTSHFIVIDMPKSGHPYM